jgi:hypothetical protein
MTRLGWWRRNDSRWRFCDDQTSGHYDVPTSTDIPRSAKENRRTSRSIEYWGSLVKAQLSRLALLEGEWCS